MIFKVQGPSVLAEEAIKILKASTFGWIESATLQRNIKEPI